MATLNVYHQVRFTDESGRFASSVDEGAHLAVVALAENGADASAAAAPRRTGRLAASIVPYVIGFLAAGWGTGVPYAHYQDEGTGPKGRVGQFLTNREDFAARGPVGGTPAAHFIEKGAAVVRAQANAAFKAFLP